MCEKLEPKVLATLKHPLYLLVLGEFAGLLRDEGDPAAGEVKIRRCMELVATSPLKWHPSRIEGHLGYGDGLLKQGAPPGSEEQYKLALMVAETIGDGPRAETTKLAEVLGRPQ